MKGMTQRELQVFLPIFAGGILNLAASFVSSDYVAGLLQGMAVMLLAVSCIYLFPYFKQRTTSSTKKNRVNGND